MESPDALQKAFKLLWPFAVLDEVHLWLQGLVKLVKLAAKELSVDGVFVVLGVEDKLSMPHHLSVLPFACETINQAVVMRQ